MGNRNINPLQNNALNINGEGNEQNLIPVEEQNQIIQERATTKKILAVRLPVYLKKETLSLHQDAVSKDKWYIKFHYDSLVNLDCYINFNASQKSNQLHKHDKREHNLSYSPSLNLANKGIIIKNLPSGENVEFSNEKAFIDINDYFNIKTDSNSTYDLCIEFVPIFPPGSPELSDNNEIIFVSLCNFEKHRENNSYEIKCHLQRLRTHGMWIDFHDIFDSSLDGGLCLVCCSVIRNTIFLPCKHAACCDHCGSEIKLRFKPCPICKTPIDDLLIIDSDEKKYEGNILDIDDENNIDEENNNNNGENNIEPEMNNDNNNIINVNENLNVNLINNNNDNNNNNNIDNNNIIDNNINNNDNNINNNNINNNDNNNNENDYNILIENNN